MIDVDRWLRRLWLVNGVALLGLFVLGLGVLAYAGLSELFRGSSAEAISVAKAPVADRGDAAPRAVRLSEPEPVRGSSARIVFVHHGTAQMGVTLKEGYVGSGFSSGRGDWSPQVNVLFLQPDGTGQLLFHEPVLIESVDYPGGDGGSSADTTFPKRAWIAYRVVEKDGNGNGRLDDDDQPVLFVSDLEGRRLRRVLPDRYWPDQLVPIGDGSRLLVYALEPQAERDRQARERMRQRAFVYDARTDRLTRHPALDSLTEVAGRIMAR